MQRKINFYLIILFTFILLKSCKKTSTLYTVIDNNNEKCIAILKELVLHSSIINPFIDNLSLSIEEEENDHITIKLFDKTDSQESPIGWIIFDVKNKKLLDITNDIDNPKELKYDYTIWSKFINCHFKSNHTKTSERFEKLFVKKIYRKAKQVNQNNKVSQKEQSELIKINCEPEKSDSPNYILKCYNIKISNAVLEGNGNNKYELITISFKDIEKAIIRKINNEDIKTSTPLVYFSSKSKNHIIFFPIDGDNHFGWKIYLYKNKILYPVGQRVMYWKPEYEESNINYSDILKIYELKDSISVKIPSKYIIEKDLDYKNYPNYSDGEQYTKNSNSYYIFPTSNLDFYRKYDNNLFEGDYNKMINSKIINLIK